MGPETLCIFCFFRHSHYWKYQPKVLLLASPLRTRQFARRAFRQRRHAAAFRERVAAAYLRRQRTRSVAKPIRNPNRRNKGKARILPRTYLRLYARCAAQVVDFTALNPLLVRAGGRQAVAS